MAELQNRLSKKQTNKKISAAQLGSEHDNMMKERRRQPSTGQKRTQMNTLADSNYFYTEINTVHKFSCTYNFVYVHVTCTVVTVHAICKVLASPYQQVKLPR